MDQNKTQETDASVDAYLDAIEDPRRRDDCRRLAALFEATTGFPPRLWGPSIVGFGRYHYRYESGREGDMCLVGFSSRRESMVLYLGSEFPERESLLPRLGKHKEGTGCVYVKRWEDVDPAVLADLIRASVAHTQTQWGRS